MSIWDEIIDIFKSKDQLENEKKDAVNSAMKNQTSLLDSLSELERQYDNSLPERKEKDYSKLVEEFNKLEKLDNMKSDIELSENAKKDVYENYDYLIDEIKKKFNADIDMTLNKKNNVENDGVVKLKKLKDIFENNKNDIENKMISSGLYNSSIKNELDENNIKNLDNGTKETVESVKNNLDKIDNNISELEEKKKTAINDFDVETVKNYNQKLEKLKQERNKEKQKIFVYNENLKSEKQRYDINREKLIANLRENDYKNEREQAKFKAEEESSNGYSGAKRENYQKRYNLAYDFYNSLPKEVALDVVKSSPSIKSYLGLYYEALVDSIKSRSDDKSIFNR